MSVTRKKLYFARPVAAVNLVDLIRERLGHGARMRALGYTVVDPYAPLLERFEGRRDLTPGGTASAEVERTVLDAIEHAAAADPYFALLGEHYRQGAGAAAHPGIASSSVLALASPEQADAIGKLDARRVAECDLLVIHLSETYEGRLPEVEIARSLGMLRFALVAGAEAHTHHGEIFNAVYSDFEELLSVLEVHSSGEGPYLTTAPVNVTRGDVLIYAIDMASLYPHILVKVARALSYPRRLFSFCCERSHVHELAQKLPVMLRLGGVGRVAVLTKDGSPHDVQMHTMVQEVVENVGYSGQVVHHVVEHGELHTVSSAAVKASRHLHMTARLLANQKAEVNAAGAAGASARKKPCVGIIVGGKSDLPSVEGSGLRALLERDGIAHTFEVVSSDREPERLRRYCLANAQTWDVVIAIAGGVPNLPIAVMSWVRGTPVISVPIEERLDLAAAALTTPPEAPVILTGYGEKGLRKAGELAVQLLTWKSRA